MNKIINIIVDDLPCCCEKCWYLYYDGKPNKVPICGVLLRDYDNETVNFDVKTDRPVWCPLISQSILKKVVVAPHYDNAWNFIQTLFEGVK